MPCIRASGPGLGRLFLQKYAELIDPMGVYLRGGFVCEVNQGGFS